MRELVLKNIISDDHRRKDIVLSESCKQKDYLQKLDKRFIYTVKDIVPITKDFNLEAYLNHKKDEGQLQPKQTYIVKEHDSKTSKVKFIYRVCGDVYTASDNKLYLIGLTQYLKLELTCIPE